MVPIVAFTACLPACLPHPTISLALVSHALSFAYCKKIWSQKGPELTRRCRYRRFNVDGCEFQAIDWRFWLWTLFYKTFGVTVAAPFVRTRCFAVASGNLMLRIFWCSPHIIRATSPKIGSAAPLLNPWPSCQGSPNCRWELGLLVKCGLRVSLALEHSLHTWVDLDFVVCNVSNLSMAHDVWVACWFFSTDILLRSRTVQSPQCGWWKVEFSGLEEGSCDFSSGTFRQVWTTYSSSQTA